jgi:RHS repeat-associated protein
MNLGYTGKPYDPTTGLYNYGFRDYQSIAARFTTEDPIRDGNNWFAYVNNDPVNFIDPWGLNKQDPKGGATGNGTPGKGNKALSVVMDFLSTASTILDVAGRFFEKYGGGALDKVGSALSKVSFVTGAGAAALSIYDAKTNPSIDSTKKAVANTVGFLAGGAGPIVGPALAEGATFIGIKAAELNEVLSERPWEVFPQFNYMGDNYPY